MKKRRNGKNWANVHMSIDRVGMYQVELIGVDREGKRRHVQASFGFLKDAEEWRRIQLKQFGV